jgi:hypothetical protein
VPALADVMGRKGVGIELSRRYFDAFVKRGYSRIGQEARATTEAKSGDLAVLILTLRALKFPKSLFTQISREDRLGSKARDYIVAMLVTAAIPRSPDAESKPIVNVTILAKTAAAARRIRAAATLAIAKSPLTKFGLTPRVEVLAPSEWEGRTFRLGRTGARWYQYHRGSFNSYSAVLTASGLREALQGSRKTAQTRVPPIFSNLGARIRPGILD